VTGGSLPKLSLPDGVERSLSRLTSSGPARDVSGAEHSQAFKLLVRTGFLARGLTYGLVGVLALALAFGAGTAGAKPDQQGALDLVARAPLGFVALIVIAAGLLAYAIWKFSQAFFGTGPEGGGGAGLPERAINAGGGVVYLLFCGIAIEILAGSGGSSGGSPKRAAGGVLSWPGGPWIVGIAGVALIAGCLVQAYYGLSGTFTKQDKTEQMDRDQLRRFCLLGKVGFCGRAIVLGLIGYFLLQAAITYNPGNAVGVDGALAKLHHQTLGPWLVGLVGLGLIVFSAFSFFEARYRRL
jgi:hypothetical protein